MHIDVNNAFLSWTAIDLLSKGYRYDIRKSYAVIGGDETKRRGIVVAKSIPCKKLGIQTAETLYSARRKCPVLKVYPADYLLYKKMSDTLFSYIEKYSPDIEILSIDECFLDYTKVRNLYGDAVVFAHKLKNEIYQNLGFTVNIGIGNNKLCAKMASDFDKPNKVHTLWASEVKQKLWPLPVHRLYGVGKRSAEKLKILKIHTIYDLAHANESFLYKYLKNNAHKFIQSANGQNNEEVVVERESKGISNSITLEKDYTNITDIDNILLAMSENVAKALHQKGRYAKVVAVQMKDHFFAVTSHQIKLTNAVCTSKEIYDISKKLFRDLWKGEPVRLLAIRLDTLVSKASYQVSLFEKLEEKEENQNLEDIIFSLREKYGSRVIQKGSLSTTKINKKYHE